jgi:hypothetical protein
MRAIIAALTLCAVTLAPAAPRDDGRYANDPLHAWFDQLASGKDLCCSFADGFSVQDVDWETRDRKYRVRLLRATGDLRPIVSPVSADNFPAASQNRRRIGKPTGGNDQLTTARHRGVTRRPARRHDLRAAARDRR